MVLLGVHSVLGFSGNSRLSDSSYVCTVYQTAKQIRREVEIGCRQPISTNFM